MQIKKLMRRLGYILCILLIGLTLSGCQEEPAHESWALWDHFEVLSKELAKQFNQKWITSGTSTQLGEGIKRTHWAYTVMEIREITLPEAHILAAKMLKTMLDAVLEDPLYVNYYIKRHPEDASYSEQIEPEGFGFRVTFWDKEMDRPKPPFISQIQAAEGWCTFHLADPATQALMQPPVETISYRDLLIMLEGVTSK